MEDSPHSGGGGSSGSGARGMLPATSAPSLLAPPLSQQQGHGLLKHAAGFGTGTDEKEDSRQGGSFAELSEAALASSASADTRNYAQGTQLQDQHQQEEVDGSGVPTMPLSMMKPPPNEFSTASQGMMEVPLSRVHSHRNVYNTPSGVMSPISMNGESFAEGAADGFEDGQQHHQGSSRLLLFQQVRCCRGINNTLRSMSRNSLCHFPRKIVLSSCCHFVVDSC